MAAYKICATCKVSKDTAFFYFRSDKPHLLQSSCKPCVAIRSQKTRLKNPLKYKEVQRLYHIRNREKRVLYTRAYNKSNKHIRAKKDKYKYHNDINFRMATNLRNRLRLALKKSPKSLKTYELIGCSLHELREYISSLFKEGMTWDNYGDWQIDHIAPCASFDLSDKHQQLVCFNYKNLQPLWKEENLEKRAKLDWKGGVDYR